MSVRIRPLAYGCPCPRMPDVTRGPVPTFAVRLRQDTTWWGRDLIEQTRGHWRCLASLSVSCSKSVAWQQKTKPVCRGLATIVALLNDYCQQIRVRFRTRQADVRFPRAFCAGDDGAAENPIAHRHHCPIVTRHEQSLIARLDCGDESASLCRQCSTSRLTSINTSTLTLR